LVEFFLFDRMPGGNANVSSVHAALATKGVSHWLCFL
jgi:hypothetical protein